MPRKKQPETKEQGGESADALAAGGASRSQLDIIRTDTVISRLPAHNLFGQGSVDIEINKQDEHGQTKLSWNVTFNPRYGEAGQLAYKIETLIINRRIDEAGRPVPSVIRLGSLNEICRELDVAPSGAYANQIKNALSQNAGALISADLYYRSKDGTRQRLQARFTKYSVAFTGEELPNGERSDGVTIILNEQYRKVLNRVNTRPLDFQYLKSLRPSAQRFYEIISYQIYAALKHGYAEARLTYSDYCAYSAQPRQTAAAPMNKQMYKIHKPHLDSGYLEKVSYQPTRDEEGRVDWVMSYVPGPRAREEFERFNRKHLIGDQSVGLDLVAPQYVEADEAVSRLTPGQLLAHFHLLARGKKNYRPRPESQEISQAEEVIRRLGTDGAWFFVEYAVSEARKTNFAMRQFGGALQYLDDAVEAFRRQEEAREAAEEREAEEQSQYDTESELRRLAESRLRSLPTERYDSLLEEARQEILKKSPAARTWEQEVLDRTAELAVIRKFEDESFDQK
jgi:hypothetical protein